MKAWLIIVGVSILILSVISFVLIIWDAVPKSFQAFFLPGDIIVTPVLSGLVLAIGMAYPFLAQPLITAAAFLISLFSWIIYFIIGYLIILFFRKLKIFR